MESFEEARERPVNSVFCCVLLCWDIEVSPKQNTFMCTQGFPVDSLWIPYRFHISSGMGCEAHELLDFGAKRRAVGATQMNATSSRPSCNGNFGKQVVLRSYG